MVILHLDKCKKEELSLVEEIVAAENLDLGILHKRICFNFNSRDWYIIRAENGEVAGVTIFHRLSADYTLRYMSVVRPKFRGSGQLYNLVESLARKEPIMGTIIIQNSPMSLHSFTRRDKFAKYGEKLISFVGMTNKVRVASFLWPDLGTSVNVRISALSSEDLTLIKTYDKLIHATDRTRLFDILSCITTTQQDYFTISIAIKDGKCVGYGMILVNPNFSYIMPLYAQHSLVALQLLHELIKSLPDDFICGIYTPARQTKVKEILRFCNFVGWKFDSTAMTVYRGNPPKINWNQVFGVHEYFIV